MKKIITVTFMLLLVSIMGYNILSDDQIFSNSERRTLKQFPEISFETILKGDLMTELEAYVLDQFAFRESFRRLRTLIDSKVFMKSDINDLYEFNGHIGKIEYPYDTSSVKKFIDYIETVQGKYLKDNPTYIGIIPDKNYYINHELKLDYDDMIKSIATLEMTFIDLFSVLSLEDYYKTDAHWRQERLEDVVKSLSEMMNFKAITDFSNYELNHFEQFYGVYYGQYAQKFDSEFLSFLTNDAFKDVKMINLEKPNDKANIYELDKLSEMDPYDVFLGGASPIITLENPNALNEKELILFRDSFGSSLSPLLIMSYKKITLVDTRYVSYDYLENFIEFDHQDVLFLYNTLVINNSTMLK